MNETSGPQWLLGDLETCQPCAMGTEKEWQDCIYNPSLFSFLVKGMFLVNCMFGTSKASLSYIGDVGEVQTLFSVEHEST